MSIEEKNKDVLRRWYDEMWGERKFRELMPELAGSEYLRHEPEGTRTVLNKDYAEEVAKIGEKYPSFDEFKYELIAEGEKVAVVGVFRVSGLVVNWVQVFRLKNEKIVETWWSGSANGVDW